MQLNLSILGVSSDLKILFYVADFGGFGRIEADLNPLQSAKIR
jgi:hypothetical protein